MKYVAIQSFRDPFDGGEIVKGRTFVSREADVFKKWPERFEIARTYPGFDGAINRLGPTVELVDRPRHKIAKSSSPRTGTKRPSWRLGDVEEFSYRDVELREHFVSYKVRLTHSIGRDSTLATEMSMRWHLAL
jgi:hypothetical protein